MKYFSVPGCYKEKYETPCNVLFLYIFRIDPYRANVSNELPWDTTLNNSPKNANVKTFLAIKNSRHLRVPTLNLL